MGYRKEFKPHQKAAIFVRDRATCAFSGQSLWYFDAGVRPNHLNDWVDHVVPCTSGGLATEDNGVCASDIHNVRKGAEGTNESYLFRHGQITKFHLYSIGAPSPSVLEGLERRSNLVPSDYYLNRTVGNTYDAFWSRSALEFRGKRYKRDDQYFISAAWKRFEDYRRRRPPENVMARGLVASPMPHGTAELLDLENVTDITSFVEWAESIWPMFRAANAVIHRCDQASERAEWESILNEAGEDPLVHPEIVLALRLLESDPPGGVWRKRT